MRDCIVSCLSLLCLCLLLLPLSPVLSVSQDDFTYFVFPFDYGATTDRAGLAKGPPQAGERVICVILTGGVGLALPPHLSLHVNGQDARDSFQPAGTGFMFWYNTMEDNELWPWTGLSVVVAVEDQAVDRTDLVLDVDCLFTSMVSRRSV